MLTIDLLPGDAVSLMLGEHATKDAVAALRDHLGLDKPFAVRYVDYVGRVARGDLGRSIFLDKPVTVALAERAQPTLTLTILALLVSLVIGLPTGVIAARARGSWLDLGTMGVAMVGIAMPTFWLGLNLIFIFAVLLRWLPVAGYQPLSAGPWEALRYLILPAVTLGVAQGALLARMTRSMMLEVLDQDYVRTARAKGLTERAVVIRHALRNAFIPLLTVIGLSFAALMGGAVVTEQIFTIPGVGRLLIQAIGRRDFPLVQGTVLVIAALYVLINLGVDLLYAVVDPRIHHA
jgi:peptide/nickel transport system permease protein